MYLGPKKVDIKKPKNESSSFKPTWLSQPFFPVKKDVISTPRAALACLLLCRIFEVLKHHWKRIKYGGCNPNRSIITPWIQSERQITPSGMFLGIGNLITCLCGKDRRGAVSVADKPSAPSIGPRPWNLANLFMMDPLSTSWHSILKSTIE